MKTPIVVIGIFIAAPTVLADEATVIEGLPPGVLILDAIAASVPDEASVSGALDAPQIPLAVTQTPASVRSPAPLEFETLEPNVSATSPTPLVDLAPGERIMDVLVVPSIVKVPDSQPQPLSLLGSIDPVQVERMPPAPRVDPVKGKLRDTPGWTGRTDDAASVGCFPAGACAGLNSN